MNNNSFTLLKKARQTHTQSQIAEILEVDVRTIRRWEMKKTEPPAYLSDSIKNRILRKGTKEKIKFIDLFSGIGGIKMGFEANNFHSVFSNDYDSYCKTTFDHNFAEIFKPETELYLSDIAKIPSNILPEFDVLTGGFPCQPFSIAGYQKGFNDNGRGDLFFEIVRILKDRKPKAFLLENVKNLKTHDNGKTLALIYKELENIGYFIKDQVINSMSFGNVPQNRERIYIIGFLDESRMQSFSFPEKIPLTKSIHDCLETTQIDNKYYYNDKPLFEKIKDDINKKSSIYQWRRKYVRENKSNVCPTLTANMGMGGHNVPIILDNKGIRKLTPRECANFQGFPIEYLLPKIADSQLYKQIGNSVSVPIITRIAKNMEKVLIA